MPIKIKICGIRRRESALLACQLGADFLGFNFVTGCRRFIKPKVAKRIIVSLGKKVKTVGIFQEAGAGQINALVDFLNLDFVQLHGREDNRFCQLIKTKVIKAFSLTSNFDLEKTRKLMKSYAIAFYLVDRERQGKGAILDLSKIGQLAQELSLFFAGGLTANNVEEIIREVKPYGVDVAAGIESRDREDLGKIREFIKKAKEERLSSFN